MNRVGGAVWIAWVFPLLFNHRTSGCLVTGRDRPIDVANTRRLLVILGFTV